MSSYIFFLVGLSLLSPSLASAKVYTLANTAVTGSARQVALSGATIAIPDDYSAVFLNPAGLAGMSGQGFDFGSDANIVDNFVVDLDDPKSRSLNAPLRYSYFGLKFVAGSGWGFGLAAQTPYSLDQTFVGTGGVRRKPNGTFVPVLNTDLTEVGMVAETYSAAAARAFFDGHLGLGAAMNYNRVTQSYALRTQAGSTIIERSIQRDQVSGDFGALIKPVDWLQFGLAYKMGYRIGFEDSLNQGLPNGSSWFGDAKVPDRVTGGLAWRPSPAFTLFLQSVYTMRMRDTLLAGSGLFPGQPAQFVRAGQYDTIDGHWGAEVIPVDRNDLAIKIWAGGYLENTGVQGDYSRYHRTAGFQVAPWFFSLTMAVDDAELYNNFAVGFGVDLFKVAKRTASFYGWKLPI